MFKPKKIKENPKEIEEVIEAINDEVKEETDDGQEVDEEAEEAEEAEVVKTKETTDEKTPTGQKINLTSGEVISLIEFNLHRAIQSLQLLK